MQQAVRAWLEDYAQMIEVSLTLYPNDKRPELDAKARHRVATVRKYLELPAQTDPDLLMQALRWQLEKGAYVVDSGSGFQHKGCGCCAYELEPPAEIDAIVREVRREVLKAKT